MVQVFVNKFKWKKIVSIILLFEVIVINYKWRQEFSFIKPDMKTYAQEISEHILKNYNLERHISVLQDLLTH